MKPLIKKCFIPMIYELRLSRQGSMREALQLRLSSIFLGWLAVRNNSMWEKDVNHLQGLHGFKKFTRPSRTTQVCGFDDCASVQLSGGSDITLTFAIPEAGPINEKKIIAIIATIAAITRIADNLAREVWGTDDPRLGANQGQTICVQIGISEGINLSGAFSIAIHQYLMVQHEEKKYDAMKFMSSMMQKAYVLVTNESIGHPKAFNAEVGKNGYLSLVVLGNVCGINPAADASNDLSNEDRGYDFHDHNLSTLAQLVSLIFGLAALATCYETGVSARAEA